MKLLSKLKVVLPMLLATFVIFSCGDSDSEEAVPSLSTDAGSEGLRFASSQSDQKTLTVTCNMSWEIENLPTWLSASKRSGDSGTTTITLTTNSANTTSAELRDQLVLKAGDVTEAISVSQESPYLSVNVEVVNEVLLAYGFAGRVKFGDKTTAFSWQIYKKSVYPNMSDNKIEAESASWTFVRKTSTGVQTIDYNQCEPSTDYKLVIFPYSENNQRGEKFVYDFKTKSASDQPQATISDVAANVQDGNKTYYTWKVSTNQYSSKYYTYVCASNSRFPTYERAEQLQGIDSIKRGALIALYMDTERQQDQTEGHIPSPSFNSDTHEWFFAPASGNGTQRFEKHSDDRFLEIVTWAENVNGVLSGIVSDVIVDLGGTTNYTLEVTPASLSFDSKASTTNVTVTSNDSWSVSSDATWCSVTPASASENGTISIYVTANTSGSDRSATITVKGNNSGISRTIGVTQAGGGGGRTSNCETHLSAPVTFTDGMVTAYAFDSDVAQFYMKVFTQSYYLQLKNDEDQLVELLKDDNEPDTPEEWEGYIMMWQGSFYTPATNYYWVSVSYDKDGNRGPVVAEPFITNSESLHKATLSNLKLGTNNSGEAAWTFNVSLDNGATGYYIYKYDGSDYIDVNEHYLAYWMYEDIANGDITSTYSYTNVAWTKDSETITSILTYAINSKKKVGNHSCARSTSSSNVKANVRINNTYSPIVRNRRVMKVNSTERISAKSPKSFRGVPYRFEGTR